jgi:hypothetical protein
MCCVIFISCYCLSNQLSAHAHVNFIANANVSAKVNFCRYWCDYLLNYHGKVRNVYLLN